MAQRRHHYEYAFERFLRDQRVPYISWTKPRNRCCPIGRGSRARGMARHPARSRTLISSSTGDGGNLLVEVKGRRLPKIRLKDGAPAKPRMESWVTLEDIEALQRCVRCSVPSLSRCSCLCTGVMMCLRMVCSWKRWWIGVVGTPCAASIWTHIGERCVFGARNGGPCTCRPRISSD